MRTPPIPPHEHERLEVLRCCDILDTPPEKEFDDLAQLAAMICGTPMALITLVDETRQWFKARVGIDSQETSRDISFCAHAVANPDAPLVVEDPERDERFRGNPDVIGGLHIRFYAGIPLVTRDGYALGTLCVVDRVHRSLDDAQMDALQALARQAVSQLELRRTSLELDRARRALHHRQKAAALHDLVMGVAHEVNNPLTFIATSAELSVRSLRKMLEQPDATSGRAQVEELLKRQQSVLSGAKRLARVSQTLLRITREGEHASTRARVSLADIVDAAAYAIAPRREHIAREFSDAPHVMASAADLTQALVQLVENAEESMADDPEGRLTLRVRARDRTAIAEITDEGCGVPPAEQHRLFTPFYTTKHDRMGCGLAIARRIVESHEGRIEFESRPGAGSTFRVVLPRVD